VWTTERTPLPPGTPHAPTGNASGAQPPGVINLPAAYTYSHTAFPRGDCFADGEDTQHETDFDPDMLTDDGKYTICFVVMQVTFILKTKAAD
jgi:hypothetical protein